MATIIRSVSGIFLTAASIFALSFYYCILSSTAMHIFKISFLKNRVLSIMEAELGTHFDGNVFYEQVNGQLIFAIVKADTREQAADIAKEIADSMSTRKADA